MLVVRRTSLPAKTPGSDCGRGRASRGGRMWVEAPLILGRIVVTLEQGAAQVEGSGTSFEEALARAALRAMTLAD